MRAAVVSTLAVVLIAHPSIARADRSLAEAFEANLGPVVPVSPRAIDGTLFMIGLPLQIPIMSFERVPVLRVVLEPVLVIGTRSSRDESDTASVTFRHRTGMRFVGPIGKQLQIVTGVGSTSAHAVLGARMDFYATRTNPADVTFLVGIAAF
jgi:hypothetical protein